MACGTNLLTGQQIAGQKLTAAVRHDFSRPLWIAAAALIAIVVLGGAAYGAYVVFRDPVTQATGLVEQGRVSEANRILEEYVDNNAESARGWLALGEVQWRTRQYASAADSFEQVQELNPREEQAGKLALLALRGLDDPSNSSREIAVLERHVEHHPEDGEAWYLLALARGADGDSAGQLEAMEQALRLGADEPHSRGLMGVGLALQGQYEQAAEAIREVLEDAPQEGDLEAALGFVAHMQGNHDAAIQHLEDALDQGTELEREVRTQLGLLLVAEGRAAEAQSHLQAVTAQADARPVARFFQAVSQRGRGRQQDALNTFEQLMEEDHPFAQHAAAQAADIYLDRGDTSAAREAVEQALQALGDSAPLLTLEGRIHMIEEEYDEARELFRRAIQIDSEYAPARLENGLLLVQRRAFSEGIRELERYVELIDPETPGAQVDDVNALIEQLKQSGAAARRASAARARVRS
ncbi:MAG: tetratricopeptide repeat protein [Candidatus Hydrogenedentota bacterium]